MTFRTWLAVAWVLGATSCTKKPEAPPAAPPIVVRDAGPAPKGIALYRAAHELTRDGRVVLRVFQRDGVESALVVRPADLSVEVVPRATLNPTPLGWAELQKALEGTPYMRALFDAEQHASALQDAGLTHLLPSERGVVLTVDLCPTRKRFAAELVKAVLDAFEPEERPVPIAFAVTGVWMSEHADDVAALAALHAKRDLDITWINHSFHHRFDPALPLTQNFLLEKGTDLEAEVLDTERALLERGLMPSVFFRFPGLISEAPLVQRVVALGVIPVGSDAWLAKRERAKPGSIVLVHGNGNEPQGVEAFMQLIAAKKRDIVSKQFLLLDLRTAVDDEEAARDASTPAK